MYGANGNTQKGREELELLSPMYGANPVKSVSVGAVYLLSPMYGANKNKFYKYSYFSIRYIIKPIIT